MDYMIAAQEERVFLTETYRYFHRFPEPSRKEFRTHEHIRKLLSEMGVAYHTPAPNITIAEISAGEKCIGMRADTDALQQTEETGLPHASENPGLMHACGHDAHMACMLAAAKLLKQQEHTLKGRVKLIFQPAEEGELGAQATIQTGLVNDVSAFFCIHVWSAYPTGEMHISSGGVAASCDMFTIRIHGQAGHGASPHECIDTVVCGSALVQNLQPIASRFTSPLDPVVVTIGSFHAGTRCNIIAGEAVLEGTIRTFNPETYTRVHEHFDRIIRTTCEAYGCTYEVDMRPCGSVIMNDESLVRTACAAAKKISPEGALPDRPYALADDFSDYAVIAPLCYAKVGIYSEAAGSVHAHHSECFRIDEDALPTVTAWLCATAEEYVNQ